jgi:hypothetical protein
VRLLLFIFLLLTSRVAFSQAARPWPRNAATGKIEFTGCLPWPDSVRTEAQRQLLVRRWYRRKLTNDKPAMIQRLIQYDGSTYAGVPAYSCYRIGIMGPDEERFSLCFKLALSADNAYLTFRLTDFECTESVFDAVTGASLEEALKLPDARVQSFMELFHEQLLAGTKVW